jgi:hypothetical protein
MITKTLKNNELAGKLKYTGKNVIRTTAEGRDFVFVPGAEYENLPNVPYFYALLKQGYFVPVASKKVSAKTDETNSTN